MKNAVTESTDYDKENFIRSYRDKISQMVEKIDDERFLRRLYIIIQDYVKEKAE